MTNTVYHQLSAATTSHSSCYCTGCCCTGCVSGVATAVATAATAANFSNVAGKLLLLIAVVDLAAFQAWIQLG